MTDYYAILGVAKTASAADIKTAFRKLAKIYHPDKNPTNPQSSVLFEKILKAYNVLINPNTRRRYDDSTTYKTTTSKKTKTPYHKQYKERNATNEEELKRRNYYKEYYKQAEQKIKPVPQNTYSDYKYILFATPLAVGLLMLVMSLFNKEPEIKSNVKPTQIVDTFKLNQLK